MKSLILASVLAWTSAEGAAASAPEIHRWTHPTGAKSVPALVECVKKSGARVRLIDRADDYVEYTANDSQELFITVCMAQKGYAAQTERFDYVPGSKITYID